MSGWDSVSIGSEGERSEQGRAMALPDTSKVVAELPPPLRPMLAPLVKTAFGFGVGTVAGVALWLATLILAVRGGEEAVLALDAAFHSA